ncbi:MAG TPA: hypothetical protein VFY36_07790 [Solirubrobacteraceae bacterium]|nr:hypothetical protein [Solirubrobacteraceae bacterium]
MVGMRSSFDTLRGVAAIAAAAAAAMPAGADAADGVARDRPSRPQTVAVAARMLMVHDVGKLHLLSADGNTLIEEGRAYGTLPGRAHVTLSFNGATITSTFTFYLKGGSISGRARAKLHSGSGHFESFGGSAAIKVGTGRYAHISGKGGFYGVFDRSNSNAEVQVIGKLHL